MPDIEAFEEVVDLEVVDIEEDPGTSPPSVRPERQNLLRQDTVTMTVLAQDPSVRSVEGPVLARIPVPADRLQRGPRNHRFHVVDVAVGGGNAGVPVVLHAEDPWTYVDEWADTQHSDAAALVENPAFRAQNVFAIAAHTLTLFERHLGRPIPWQFGWPHLYLVPAAKLERNAAYTCEHNAVLFGWLPALGERPRVYTSLSYDVIAHEVSHAVLDGLRPRYTEPGLPDQLAFHEALADLVALLSVFDLDGVAEHLLDPEGDGVLAFPTDATTDPDTAERRAGRAAYLKATALTGLAEQLGGLRAADQRAAAGSGSYPALRRSVNLEAGDWWKAEPWYLESHRRAEILVAAFMQTFVEMWAGRLDVFRVDGGGMNTARMAEEGTKAARHLLGMLLRALDYLPPVELEFPDVIDAVLAADRRLAPDDEHDYRGALQRSFGAFGIVPPPHRIVDEDGTIAPGPEVPDGPVLADYPADPDTVALGIRYEHLNLLAMRTSPEEVFQFIWSNAAVLGIDVRFSTRVDRVLTSTRVGPDGLIVTEVIADYSQWLGTTAGNLPPGIAKPDNVTDDKWVELWGGGVLVFDQFGRFRLHQRKPLLDVDRQTRRLDHLARRGLTDASGGLGTNDQVRGSERFAMLHRDVAEDSW
jgi:hypothetical protein